MRDEASTIAFRYSKPAMLRLTLVAALLAVLSGTVALRLFSNVKPGSFAEFAGYAGVLLFGCITALFVTRMFRSGPIVEVGAQGICDRRVSSDVIAWENIDRMQILQVRQQYFLRLKLYVPSQLNRAPISRILALVNAAGGISDVSINMAGLNGSFDDLVGAVDRYRKAGTAS